MLTTYEKSYITGLSHFVNQQVYKAIKENKETFTIILNGYVSPEILLVLKSSNLKITTVPVYYKIYGAHYTIWKHAILFD